jgi:hypothetical protein
MLSSIYSDVDSNVYSDVSTNSIDNISIMSIKSINSNYPIMNYHYDTFYKSSRASILDNEIEIDNYEIDSNILDYYINRDNYNCKKHITFAEYNRIFFDIQETHPCYLFNLKSKLNIFLLKRKYKKELTKNIFLSKYNPKNNLYNLFTHLNSNELTIFYKFESWNEFSNIFGWYKGMLFYTIGNNLHIDYLAEYLPDCYLEYILKLKYQVIGNVYYVEKFTITKGLIINQDSLFTLIHDILSKFYNRN